MKKHTLSLAQLLSLVAAIIALALLAVAGAVYSASSMLMEDYARELNSFSVTTSGRLIDQTLLSVEQYIFDLMYDDPSLTELNEAYDSLSLYQAKGHLNEQMTRMGRLYTLDGIMMYSPAGKEAEQLLYSSNPRLLKQNIDFSDALVESILSEKNEDPLPNSKWFVQNQHSVTYLVRIISLHESYCAVWINTDSLTGLFASEENDMQGNYYFDNFEKTAGNRAQEKALISTARYDSKAGEFSLYLTAEFSEFHRGLQSAIPIISIALVILIPLLWLTGYFFIYLPFIRFNRTMLYIADGNIQIRASGSLYIREFKEMYQIFNRMMDDIQSLKLTLYENKLNAQKVEQQFLHIQIRNHFFLNCLNIIYALAQIKDFELIQQMTLYLVSYFRHISKNAMEGVSLQDEVEHVNDYIRIQQIRFPSRIQFSVHMDPSLADFQVPSLILLTFIENCIVHALTPDQSVTCISLDLCRKKRVDTAGLHIKIYDNGPGFSSEQLEKLNSADDSIKLGEIHGIGIHNIRCRLQLLYGSKAYINFCNNKKGGALIELYLPEWMDKEMK